MITVTGRRHDITVRPHEVDHRGRLRIGDPARLSTADRFRWVKAYRFTVAPAVGDRVVFRVDANGAWIGTVTRLDPTAGTVGIVFDPTGEDR